MKKNIILILVIGLLFLSCIPIEEETNNGTASFYMTDSTGFPMSIFSPGQSFYLGFYLVNNSDSTLQYIMSDSGPEVRFKIYQDTTYIAGSMDGYGVFLPVFTVDLAPGDSIRGKWLAPTTPAQDPKVRLEPGQYTAKVTYPTVSGLIFDAVFDIDFEIVEQ